MKINIRTGFADIRSAHMASAQVFSSNPFEIVQPMRVTPRREQRPEIEKRGNCGTRLEPEKDLWTSTLQDPEAKDEQGEPHGNSKRQAVGHC